MPIPAERLTKIISMSTFAFSHTGEEVDSEDIPLSQWLAMQQEAKPGHYLMTCCCANAVLKTSSNGLQFFAHFGGECGSAPETAWHKGAKTAVLAAARRLGLQARSEFPGNTSKRKWTADVFIEHEDRRIAVELQRSPHKG